jgi:U5 small nuclear ribonucleoprotein component
VEPLLTFLKKINVKISKQEQKLDIQPLLKVVLARFFKNSAGFVDVMQQCIPSPMKATATKVPLVYTGPTDSTEAKAMIACDPKGPLFVYITKLYARSDLSGFDVFGRVMSGTLHSGDKIKISNHVFDT